MTENNNHVEEEEEENGTSTEEGSTDERHWQSAYWALARGQQQDAADTYGGAFRATHPAPHGGAQSVKPEDTLGTEELCWCGLPAGHNWPGKTIGAKHPKEGNMNTQAATTLDRRDLRAYHSRLQDFIMLCVNTDELRFRVGKNAVIIYPPDGSTPMSVYARNTDRQVRSLQKWYVEHVVQQQEEEVSEAAVAELAEKVNDPVEHPLDPPKQQQEPVPVAPPGAHTAKQKDVEKRLSLSPRQKVKTESEIVAAAGQEWVPYQQYSGEPHPTVLMDGKGGYKCSAESCVGTDHEVLVDRKSIGGHMRMWHTDRSDLYTPETRAKAHETNRENRRQKTVAEAIALLIPESGGVYMSAANVAKLNAENLRLKNKVDQLEAELGKAPNVDVDALTKRAEDAEAKLAIIHEAMGL